MYATYADIDPQNHPNVGMYGIHGVSGAWKCSSDLFGLRISWPFWAGAMLHVPGSARTPLPPASADPFRSCRPLPLELGILFVIWLFEISAG